MPVVSAEDGNIVVDENDVAKVLPKGEQGMFAGPRYVSHFSNCPHAAQHRKKS